MLADPPVGGLIDDARLRIVAVLVLAFCYSTLHGAVPLALMIGLTGMLVALSGTSPATLARKLRLPGMVVAGLVVILPFTSGETVLADLGPVTLRAEGLAAAAAIALRFLCIFSLIVVFLGAVPLPRLIVGMRGLGLPALMVDMALLTLRHIEDLRADLARRAVSMRLRGAPQGFWRGLFRARGWMLASLLLHSHARSERVWQAMLLRGHGAPGMATIGGGPPSVRDKLWLTALIAVALCLLATEHLT